MTRLPALERALRALCAVALLSFSAVPFAQVLYLGKDSDGRTRITNIPPAQSESATAAREAESARPSTAAAPKPQAAPRAQVTLYSTSWCGYCAQARALFRSEGVAFVEHDVERSAEARAQHRALGGRGVPLIVIGNQTFKGYSERKIRAALASLRG